MWHAMLTSMALLAASQAPAGTRAVKADRAEGWLAPIRIRLDFRDRTLAEIGDAITTQTKGVLPVRPDAWLRVRGGPAKPEPTPRRYSLVEPGTVSFWEAIDRVGRATETRPATGNMPNGRRGVYLAPAAADRGFACNDGAFRVVLTGVSYTSGLQFAPYAFDQPALEQPKADGSSCHPSLTANLLIMAEPRLEIVEPVELVVREAVDDRGRSLIPATRWRQPLSKPAGRGYPNQEYVGISLRPLENPGKQIKHLAGSLTLGVAEAVPHSPAEIVDVGFQFADVPLP